MAGNFNLKSVFTADTKDLKQGAREAKQAVQDFDNATTAVLDDVTALFGSSMKEISTSLSTVKGGLLSFSAALKASTQGTSLFSKALGVLKVALAATGIGAIIAVLGSLVAYFTKSQRGANQLSIAVNQIGQAFKTVMDYAVKMGEGIVNAFRKPKETFQSLWKFITDGEYRKNAISGVVDDINERQEKALELSKAQIALEEKQRAFTVDRAKLQTEINKQRLIADDKLNYTTEQRLAAAKKADELTNQMYNKEIGLKKEQLSLLQLENSLSESKNQDLQAEADLEAEIISLDGQRFSALKELVTKQAELTNLAKIEREEKERIEALNKRKREDLTLKPMDSSELLKGVKVESAIVTPSINTEQLEKDKKKVTEYVVDLEGVMNDFSNALSEAFSQMIEGLVSGNVNIKDVFGTLLAFLADTLKAIGKALIAYGMAMEGFKQAIKDPYVAIAAGAALIAAGAVLGSLINKMTSSVGSGASASATYAAATVGGGSTLDLTGATALRAQSQEIKVSGTLKAERGVLTAIIENEKKRKNLTT